MQVGDRRESVEDTCHMHFGGHLLGSSEGCLLGGWDARFVCLARFGCHCELCRVIRKGLQQASSIFNSTDFGKFGDLSWFGLRDLTECDCLGVCGCLVCEVWLSFRALLGCKVGFVASTKRF